MYIAFFDESGTEDGSKVVSLAAFVIKNDKCRTFEEEWNLALFKAGICFFHMTDYEAHRPPYDTWDQGKRIRVIVELADIIKRHIDFGFCQVLIVADWLEIVKPLIETDYERKRGSYVFLAQGCLAGINFDMQMPQADKISCIFDRNNYMRGSITEHYARLIDRHSLQHVFDGITFADKTKAGSIPIQAADILAYEGAKHILNTVVDGGRIPERKLFVSLMDCQKIEMRLYAKENLSKLAPLLVEAMGRF